MFQSRPVSIALVGLFLWVTGCSTYTQIEPGEVADHDKVRITTTDGETLDYYDPRVEADSIKGRVREDSEVVYAIPLDRVAEVGLHNANTAGTVALIIVAIPVALTLTVLVYCATTECDWGLGPG